MRGRCAKSASDCGLAFDVTVRRNAMLGRPLPQGRDLLRLYYGKGAGGPHGDEQRHRVERNVGGPGLVEGRDRGLLDLGSREPASRAGERVEIETGWILRALLQMQPKAFGARRPPGEIHEEDLVHTSFPDELGGKLLDGVR